MRSLAALSVALAMSTLCGTPASASSAPAARALAVSSVYTPLGCEVTDAGIDPIDYFYSTCRGYRGYDLRHDGGDSRSWLALQLGDRKHDLFAYGSGFFPYVIAERVEWRGTARAGGGVEPFALIFRIAAQDPEHDERSIESLVVARVTRTEACVIGEIVASRNPRANAQARELADARARGTACPNPSDDR